MTFNELKIKEVIGVLRSIRGEMLVCADYCQEGEQLHALAEHLNYPIQSLEGMTNEKL